MYAMGGGLLPAGTWARVKASLSSRAVASRALVGAATAQAPVWGHLSCAVMGSWLVNHQSVVSNSALFDGTNFSGLMMADTHAKLSIQSCCSFRRGLSLLGSRIKHPYAITQSNLFCFQSDGALKNDCLHIIRLWHSQNFLP